MLTEKNLQQIKEHGLTEAKITKQLHIFKEGIPFANILEAASVANGIEVLSAKEQHAYSTVFNAKKADLDLLKFVPASGAATRMFQFLHCFLDTFDFEQNTIDEFLQNEAHKELRTFFNSLEKFPFTSLIQERLGKQFPDFKKWKKGKRYFYFVNEMLSDTGLNFDDTPKGLVPFHKYGEMYATAFDEQLYEAAFYAASKGIAQLHFTVSAEHEEKFKKRYAEIQGIIEQKTGLKFNISYSFQKKETDTVAATPNNEAFLDENNNLVFRPSGHGALLENLNEVDADIIFIKNIDNVVSENYVETIAFHKKALAGKLISLQQKIFGFVEKLNLEHVSEETLHKAKAFISEELHIKNTPINKEGILKLLDRPIRVCGVVENTGAPGGGPFLVKDKSGKASYQIVEMSQINKNNTQQKNLVEKATHFNPVDLVCGIRNYKGEKYNLLKFSDPDAGFISEKSYQGKPIKALEMPGLWNGAMANWNTIFVEVPLITFNPVKTVNDLLNHLHLPQ